MILRGKPKWEDKYIIVDSTNSLILHTAGFYPRYIDGVNIYYEKDDDILIFINEHNINCIKK